MASMKPLIIPKKPVGLASPTGFVSLDSQIKSVVDISQDAPGAPKADSAPAADAPAADATPGAPPVAASGDAVKKVDKDKEVAILARNTRRLLNVSI